jgi:ssDNA-binding Zn-finger/Zn-ribbon topoisomerase 1
MISNFTKAQSQVDRKCPKCGSIDLNRSQRVDFEERLLSMINIYPYRCRQHTCQHRFQSFGRH